MQKESTGAVDTPDASTSLPARIAAGDRQAESEFVQSYHRGVLALVRRHCRPLEPAVEDLTQEVLIAVLEKLRDGALHEHAALPGYLRSTVVLTVQAEYRKRARRDELLPVATLNEGQDDCADGNAGADPHTQMQKQSLAEHVRRLLAELQVPRDHEVLRRFYLLEHDRETICLALGIDEAHFRRVLFRARERFAALARRDGLEHAP